MPTQRELNDPEYEQFLQLVKDKVNQNLSKGSAMPCDVNNTVEIPVAVHFGPSYDCSNVQCLIDATEAQINSLNADFAATNLDKQKYNDIIDNCGGTNVLSDGVCVNFVLANKNHPTSSGLVDGMPAITIGQYQGGANPGFAFLGHGGAPDWVNYLNIFVVNNIPAGGVSGGIPGRQYGVGDGVTIKGSEFGAPGFGSCYSCGPLGADFNDLNLGRALTHEVGHYLGL